MTELLAAALVREHREIDDGIQEFVRVGDTRALTRAVRALRRHIYLEEEFLFPPLREAGLVAPILVMLREHGQLWDTLDALDQALASGGPAATVRDLCRQLMVLEQHHNPKEERILYPQVDHVPTAATTRLQEFLPPAGYPTAGYVSEPECPAGARAGFVPVTRRRIAPVIRPAYKLANSAFAPRYLASTVAIHNESHRSKPRGEPSPKRAGAGEVRVSPRFRGARDSATAGSADTASAHGREAADIASMPAGGVQRVYPAAGHVGRTDW